MWELVSGFGSVDMQVPQAGWVQQDKQQQEGHPGLLIQKPAVWLGKNIRCVLAPKTV